MTKAENPITSENYADLLIAYQGDKSALAAYQNMPLRIINEVAAIVQIPAAEISNQTILELGYAIVPSVFGLVSENSLAASEILKARNLPNFNFKGNGVLIGIIDTGIDYTNPIFQYSDKTTRIAAIWDQTIENENPPQDRGYGTDFTREQINQALQSNHPFEIVPSKDDNGHGTMIAGIAGGSKVPESNFEGVAPGVEFVVVKLKQAKKVIRDFFFIPEQAVCYQETDLQFAIQYTLNMAASIQKPIVLCIAVNTSQSFHDGKGLTSNYLSTIAQRTGIGVVIAAGNEGNSGRHYFGNVNPSIGFDTVELNVGENENGFSMELWGKTPSAFTIDILSPSGEYIPKINAFGNAYKEITFSSIVTVIHIDFRAVESETGDQLILMRFASPAPGIWKLNVYESGGLSSGFHIWLPMGGLISDDVYFMRPDPYVTILALGNGKNSITITAYNDADDSLYINSSRGYTSLGEVKPNVAAPGVNVTGPTLEHGFQNDTGTSIAAAHTAGAAAMLMEWGIVKGNYKDMNTVDINRLFMQHARRTMGVEYPNRDWGYGILDMFNVFDSLRSR